MPDPLVRPAAHRTLRLASALFAVAFAPLAGAQRYATGNEVMDAVEAQPTPPGLVSSMTMTITTGSGQTLTRSMQIWSVGDGEKQVVKFTAPADIAGSGFLSVEQEDGSSSSMIYLPALDRVRRIAGNQEQEAFFGSDFSYEDISGLRGGTREDYDDELLEVRDGPVYVVQGTPRPGADTSYERIVMEIPEATLLPTRIEFYRDGDLLKVMTIDATQTVDGYLLPTHLGMSTVASGSSTSLEQGDFTVESQIPDEVFSERFLRR